VDSGETTRSAMPTYARKLIGAAQRMTLALLLLLLIAGPGAGAQPVARAETLAQSVAQAQSHGSDDAARALAEKIDAHYNRLHTLQLRFTQSYDGMGMHRVERGTLLLSKGGRLHLGQMRWTYAQPAGKLFVLDGRNAYFYTPGQSEVQRVPARQLMADGDLRSPLALLLGHADLAKQLVGMTLTPGPDGEATLAGVPKGMERRVAQMRVRARADGTIDGLVVEETDGARNRFAFQDEQANVPAPEGAFVFVAPAGTQIVDGMPPV
jgi:outer membrane lipoprotein carrier protein